MDEEREMATDNNGHRLVALAKVPVVLLDGQVVVDPFEVSDEIIGCDTCDMGLEQVRAGHPCPGVPLEAG